MVPDLSFSNELKDMAVKAVLDRIPFLVGMGECTHVNEPILVVGLVVHGADDPIWALKSPWCSAFGLG